MSHDGLMYDFFITYETITRLWFHKFILHIHFILHIIMDQKIIISILYDFYITL